MSLEKTINYNNNLLSKQERNTSKINKNSSWGVQQYVLKKIKFILKLNV